jgi:xanthine dehydrogenase YagS FAD-binding subunit
VLASFCGIFGLKPTYGRLPQTGTFPFVASLDHLGPHARTAADLALAYDGTLVALGAEVELCDATGARRVLAMEDLHRLPGDTPDIETNLAQGEMIIGFRVPAAPWARQSRYVKARDRASYDFALVSAAVGLEFAPDGGVRVARIALGGLAAKPWRAHAAEAALIGRRLDEDAAENAALAAFTGAVTHGGNAFKPELGRRAMVRALLETARMES